MARSNVTDSDEASSVGLPVKWAARLFFAVVALSPLPLGSVSVVAPALWSIPLGLALLCLLAARLRGAQLAILAAAAMLTACALLVVHDQLAAAPWLPLTPNPLWAEAARLLPGDLAPARVLALNQPFYSAGLGIVTLLAFTAGVVLASDRQLARQLLWVVAIAGLTYAIVGMATFLIEPSRIFLIYEKRAHVTSLTSPFVNRNTAAVYYGCCALVWLMFCCELIERHLPSDGWNWARFRRRLDRRAMRKLAIFAFGWLVCLLAMFLTGSRAGAGVSLLAAVASVAMFFYRRLPRRYGVVLTIGGGLLASLVLLQLLGGGVGGRFSSLGLSDEGRLSTYRATWRMIQDHPWLGNGFGTFEWAYPAYRTDDISLSGIWNRAHNSFLELASDGGMLMASAVIIALIAAAAVLLHGVRTRRRDQILPVVALCATVAAAAHSMVDFSLQIPGYAIVIFGLLGAGLTQSFHSGRRPGNAKGSRASSQAGT